MFRMRKEMKLVLVVFTILFSTYLGVKRSNLDKIFIQTDVVIDMSKANEKFKNAFNQNKIRFEYQVEDLTEINTFLSEIGEIENTITLYSEIKSNYNLIVFEIPVEISEETINKSRSVVGVSNENIQRAGMVTDLKENLNNNVIVKKRIRNLINESVSPERITSFRSQLDVIQAKIDSLSIQEDIQKHNADFDVFFLSAIKNVNSDTALRSSMSIFMLTTIASIFLLIIGLIICYCIFVLMYKVMLVLGIRTSRGSRPNYNYNYNKKDYGRKVKRIYKDREGKVIKIEEEK